MPRRMDILWRCSLKHKSNTEDGGLLQSLIIAFSMYSRLPMPRIEWSGGGMKYVLCFFPLIGVVIGAVVSGFWWFAGRMGLEPVTTACIGTALPLLVTGGIHMDGFLDTVDARSSCQDRQRKLEILKDPHTGAFAIIGCGIYLLFYVAVFAALKEKAFPAVAGIYVMTRAFSGWSVVSFPKAKKDGLASTFAQGAQVRAVQAVMGLWAVAAAVFFWYAGGIFTMAALSMSAVIVLFWYYRMAMREFGGMTGDLAGYFLQTAELVMLAVLAVCTWQTI